MRNLFLLIICIGLLAHCKKEEIIDQKKTETAFTLSDLVDTIEGTYNMTLYCRNGSGVNGYTYDTIYDVPFIVASYQDTTLYIHSSILYFEGNFEHKQYRFHFRSSGQESYAFMDSNLQVLTYSYWDGGLGGGGGCTYIGTRNP